ncbi:MAG: hypothetical protein KDC10_04335 [Calditrichaeota bacterium]|nr:hypothetical protein [Candidatus Cloacimonadota bacterium]MCB1046409.1 hypothetical protein [Calditrichota bacterium]MCB9472734.1 hypothetical protein [Candidatus Delongbacteria bacterium]
MNRNATTALPEDISRPFRTLNPFSASTLLAALMLLAGMIPSVQAARITNAGPRVGMMVLKGADKNHAADADMSSMLSAFGWHMETEFSSTIGGARGNTSLVLLAVGADQGKLLPSATWLIGARSPGGWEVGMGPNASLAGSGFTVAMGRTRKSGELNLPFNVAGTFSPDSFRLSLLTGFNMRSDDMDTRSRHRVR